MQESKEDTATSAQVALSKFVSSYAPFGQVKRKRDSSLDSQGSSSSGQSSSAPLGSQSESPVVPPGSRGSFKKPRGFGRGRGGFRCRSKDKGGKPNDSVKQDFSR